MRRIALILLGCLLPACTATFQYAPPMGFSVTVFPATPPAPPVAPVAKVVTQ